MYVSQGRLGTCVGVPVGSYSYRGTKYSPQTSKTHRVVATGEKKIIMMMTSLLSS